MLFLGARCLILPGLRARQAGLGEPGSDFVVGKADEQKQNENQLFLSSEPGPALSGCPALTGVSHQMLKCTQDIPFILSLQLLLRPSAGQTYEGPVEITKSVHVNYSTGGQHALCPGALPPGPGSG